MYRVILLILVLCVTTPVHAADEPKAPPKGITFHRQAAGEPGSDGWYEARSTEGKFSVALPAKFNDFTQVGESREGGRIINHIVGTKTSSGVKYTALVMMSLDKKPLPANGLAAMDAKDPSLKSKREVEIDGNKGLELHIVAEKSASKIRTFDSAGRRYLLIAEYPRDADAKLLEEVDKFLTSFKVGK